MVGQRQALTAQLPGMIAGTHCIGGWVDPRKGAENLAPPQGVELLYLLSYPGPQPSRGLCFVLIRLID
jgi:hypothetical protein